MYCKLYYAFSKNEKNEKTTSTHHSKVYHVDL